MIQFGTIKILSGGRGPQQTEYDEHPGNQFYTIGAAIDDEDTLVVCDGWVDKAAFEAHDNSKEVDVWRKMYNEYVIDCVSNLCESGDTEKSH